MDTSTSGAVRPDDRHLAITEDADVAGTAQWDESSTAPPISRHWDTIAVALFAFALSAFRSNRPLFDGDELNSVSGATRSMGGLWQVLSRHDIFHGLYYYLLKFWYSVFPVNEFWGRLPSAIGVGLAAAGVVVLGKKLSTPTVAVTSGIIFSVLPRVTWAGSYLRGYGLAMAFAVWLTILCVAAARRGEDRRWWAGYGLGLVTIMVLNLHTVLIVPAHAVALKAYGKNPRALRLWALVTCGAIALVAPLAVLARRQFFQQTGTSLQLYSGTIGQVLKLQYFERPPITVGILSGMILLAGLVYGLISGPRHPSDFVSLLLAWAVVPTLLMLVASHFRPIYLPRHLSFTAPGFALLVGVCLASVVRSKVAIAAILIVFAVAASPNYFAQRVWNTRGNQRYAELADTIDQNAAPGDCVVFNDDGKYWPPLRRMTNYRPESFEKLNDPALVDHKYLYPSLRPFSKVADKLANCRVVWSVSRRDWSMPAGHTSAQDPAGHPPATLAPGPVWQEAPAYRKLAGLGFRTVERWQFGGIQLTKSVR